MTKKDTSHLNPNEAMFVLERVGSELSRLLMLIGESHGKNPILWRRCNTLIGKTKELADYFEADR